MVARVLLLMFLTTVQMTAADRVADMYAKQVALVETDLVGLAEAMPSDKYDFRPTNGEFTGVRTFGEQVKHAATMIYMTAAIVLEEKSPYGPGRTTTGPIPCRESADRRVPRRTRSRTHARPWRR